MLLYSNTSMISSTALPPVPLRDKLEAAKKEYRELVPNRNEAFDPVSLVVNFAAKGDLHSTLSEIFQLELLIKNLRDIRFVRPDVFNSLKAKIYRCGNFSNHVGLRMEARIASSLTRKGVSFKYVDAPDFRLEVEGGTAFIECTGVLPADFPRGKDMRYKIASAINGKAGKPYANSYTAVAVEASSVFAAMSTSGFADEKTDLHQYLSPLLASSPFGAAIIFRAIYDRRASYLQFVYNRFDCLGIADELKRFLDTQYPIIGGQIENPFVLGARRPFPIYEAEFPVWYQSGTVVQKLPSDGRLLGVHRHLPTLNAGSIRVVYSSSKG